MQKYRLQLGQTGHHMGGIDSHMGLHLNISSQLYHSVTTSCQLKTCF